MKRLLFVLPLVLWCTVAQAQVDTSAVSDVVNSPDSTSEPQAADVSAPAVVVTDVSVTPAPAVEVVAPPDPGKPLGEAVGGLIQAIKAGDWTLVIAFGLMILIWVIRFAWKAFPVKWTPWIAAGAAMVGAVVVALINGSDIMTAVHAGLLVSVSSGGIFSLISSVKKIKKKDE
jgi:hypothetical protein